MPQLPDYSDLSADDRDAKGNPICARVHPPYLTWSVTADGAG